ncbi:GntR family transcriptional regulator [Geodermatophilus sp. DSM 45219]|uniref:GntR family transcriptional regulator n=1 Tax=Geodermatophilus sp. DSM 45219 TaxID=1881103 RepID=UPI00087E1D43|nr:GntR family transcriptional regulator [Geodermatophilus sp. DSM 45219]SDO07063.1 transcriptional regulator, GntR family [Geodermatophilus sp. DSM 45219]
MSDAAAPRPGEPTIGERHTPLREQVLDALRSRIINGVYAPGQRLTEERLAEDFGVSRNPVREALRVVQAEGFVLELPRRGVIVASPDPTSMRDLFAVRRRLETLAARQAAERAGPVDIVGLRDLLDGARRGTEVQDFDLVAELNSALHRRIIDIGGNRWLGTLSVSLYRHVEWVFRLGVVDRAPHSWTEHVRLVEAIASGDPEAAEQAAAEHVDAAAAAALPDASAPSPSHDVPGARAPLSPLPDRPA